MGYTPDPRLLSLLAEYAAGILRQFGPQEVTNLVWSLSQLHKHGAVFTPEVDVSG